MVSRAELEDYLSREFAVNRNDVADDQTFANPSVLQAALPMRPLRVLDYLMVSADELIALVRSGALPRPARWGGNRVAWRHDEVLACDEQLRERR